MLPDTVRAQIAPLLRRVAESGAAVAVCDERRQIEVCVGDVQPHLAALQTLRGSFLDTSGDHQVFVERLSGGFWLVAVINSEDTLGDVIGAASMIKCDLDTLLSPDAPEPPPAMAAAMKGRRSGAA